MPVRMKRSGCHTWVILATRSSDTQRPKPTRQAPSEAGASAGSAALARLESLQDKKSSAGTSKAVTATRELRRQQSGSTSEPEAASEASSVVSKWDSEGEGHLEAASVDVSN